MSFSMKCDGCDKRVTSLSDLQSWKYHEKLKNVFCTDVCYASSKDGKQKGCTKVYSLEQVAGAKKIHNIYYSDQNTQLTFSVLKPLEKIVKKKDEKELPVLYPNSTHFILMLGGKIDLYLYREGKPYDSPVRLKLGQGENAFAVIPPNTQYRIENTNGEAGFISAFSPPALFDDDVV